jgi:hypothetical protein
MPAQKVYGVREAMAELKKVDEKLYFRSQQRMKRAAEPMRASIDRSFPPASPFTGRSRDGWTHNGRTSWTQGHRTQIVYGGRRYRSGDREWPLVRILARGAAAEMWDMAGSGRLADYLDGSPSRGVWPAAERHRDDVFAAIRQAADDVAEQVNARLALDWSA